MTTKNGTATTLVRQPVSGEQAELIARLRAELAQQEAENAQLKAVARARRPKKAIKVGEKGGVSVYGLGRFPVTLYKEQWEQLFAMEAEIKAFLVEHAAELKTKE